jgi:hypothetical protein
VLEWLESWRRKFLNEASGDDDTDDKVMSGLRTASPDIVDPNDIAEKLELSSCTLPSLLQRVDLYRR